jgi:hypothetical protein
VLDQVDATYDIEKRKQYMQKLQLIQQDRGTICVPNWQSNMAAYKDYLHNVRVPVHDHTFYHEAWLSKA